MDEDIEQVGMDLDDDAPDDEVESMVSFGSDCSGFDCIDDVDISENMV